MSKKGGPVPDARYCPDHGWEPEALSSIWHDDRRAVESSRRVFYVAGPMRGYSEFNFPAFARVAALLRQQGHDVISPHEHDLSLGLDPNKPLDEQAFPITTEDLLRWDLEQIIKVCTDLYMMAGWEQSEGATTEHTVARALRLRIHYELPKDERYIYGWSSALIKEST